LDRQSFGTERRAGRSTIALRQADLLAETSRNRLVQFFAQIDQKFRKHVFIAVSHYQQINISLPYENFQCTFLSIGLNSN